MTPRSAVDSYTPFSQSEAVSTHISASESDHKRSGTESSNSRSRAPRSRLSQTTESSVPEDIPDGSELSQRVPSPDKRLDSSDDTIINSSVNEEEETEGRSRSKGKKSPVGRLLPPGNSPLPQPWSRKTGSESESEESVSHTGQPSLGGCGRCRFSDRVLWCCLLVVVAVFLLTFLFSFFYVYFLWPFVECRLRVVITLS